jgi:hypothetical protein
MWQRQLLGDLGFQQEARLRRRADVIDLAHRRQGLV